MIVIEDNRLLREGICAMLSSQPGFTVLTAASDARLGLSAAATLCPTTVLLDFGLADDDSLAVCAQLRDIAPDCQVIVMGVAAPQEDLVAFIRAGAAGFIMKDASVDVFVDTIRLITDGKPVLPLALTDSLFSQILRQETVKSRTTIAEGVRLTARERQIIDLLGEGLSNKEISARLYISVHTVKSHVHNVLEKLSLHTRLEVAAFSRGLGNPHDD